MLVKDGTMAKPGCRHTTVDAYRVSLNFYEESGFHDLTSKAKNADAVVVGHAALVT